MHDTDILYPLVISHDNISNWLFKNGQQLPNIPSRLPYSPKVVYVLYNPERPQGTHQSWVILGPVNRNALDLWPKWYNWAWFEVPIKVVFPFTDAPLI